jgi:hypothetical protein
MDVAKKIAAGFLILIAAFLLLKDPTQTTAVVNGLGKGIGEVTTSLQGGR